MEGGDALPVNYDYRDCECLGLRRFIAAHGQFVELGFKQVEERLRGLRG